MKYLILFFLFFGIQPKWVDNAEKSVSRINENGKLESQFEQEDAEGIILTKIYRTENESKVNVHFNYDTLMNLSISYYESDSLIFAEIIRGKEFILFIRERQKSEPHSVLIEKKTYFKNETKGISMTKEIYVYDNSDIEKLKVELEKMKFKIEKVGNEEYQYLKKKYNNTKKEENYSLLRRNI